MIVPFTLAQHKCLVYKIHASNINLGFLVPNTANLIGQEGDDILT